MKLSDIVCFDATIARLASNKRDDVICELIDSLGRAHGFEDGTVKEIKKAIIKRENEASTGIGKGVALPHIKHKVVDKAIAAVGVSEAGIDFSSLDKQPVYSVILLISPADNADEHLRAMETIFKHLQDDNFRRFLRQSQSSDDIRELFVEVDEKQSV